MLNMVAYVYWNSWLSAESVYNTSKATSGELVDSLLGGSALNYVRHRACGRNASLAAIFAKIHVDLGELTRRKEMLVGQDRNRFHRATRNGAWISAVPHRINGTELSWE